MNRSPVKDRQLLPLLIFPLFMVLLVLTGCPKDKYKKAAVAGRNFAVAVKALQDGEIAMQKAGKVSPDIHKEFQAAFEETAQVGINYNAVIRKGNAATDADVKAVVDEALQATQRLLAATEHVPDEQTRAALMASVISIRIIVDNIQLAFAVGGNQ